MPNIELNKTTSANFELVFPVLPSETTLDAADEFVLNISNTTIPATTLDEEEHRWQAFKTTVHQGGVTFDPLTVTFIVDASYKNWKLLFEWLTYINNNYNKADEEHAAYVIDTTLNIKDNFNTSVLSLSFVNMWVQSLGDVSISYREGEVVTECQATFRYDRYEIKE